MRTIDEYLSGAPRSRPNVSRTIGFGVIPWFVLAGVLSTVYTFAALRKYELNQGGYHIISVLVGGFCLGMFMVTALWFYRRLDSWESATLLVIVIVVGNCSTLFDQGSPALSKPMDLPFAGTTEPDHFLFFLCTCLVTFIGFALVLLRRRKALWTVLIATVFAVIATLTFVSIVEGSRGIMNPFDAEGLGILWQMTLSFFLGLSLWVGQITMRPAMLQPSPDGVDSSVRNAFISLGILVLCFICVQIWTSAVVR